MRIWVTRDGQEIPINQMTDQHLLNATRFLKRRIDEADAIGPPSFQGEMAQMHAEREFDRLQEFLMYWYEVYRDLQHEIHYRKLKELSHVRTIVFQKR